MPTLPQLSSATTTQAKNPYAPLVEEISNQNPYLPLVPQQPPDTPPPSTEEEEQRGFLSRAASFGAGALKFLGLERISRVALTPTPIDIGIPNETRRQLREALQETEEFKEFGEDPTVQDVAFVGLDVALFMAAPTLLKVAGKTLGAVFKPAAGIIKKGLANANRILDRAGVETVRKTATREIPESRLAGIARAELETLGRKIPVEEFQTVFDDVLEAGLEAVQANKVLKDALIKNEYDRLFLQIGRAVGVGKINPESALQLARNFGARNTSEARAMVRAVMEDVASQSGKNLQLLSRMEAEVGAAIGRISVKAADQPIWRAVRIGTSGALGAAVGASVDKEQPLRGAAIGAVAGPALLSNRALQLWRATATSAAATTARNFVEGGLRNTEQIFITAAEAATNTFTRRTGIKAAWRPLGEEFLALLRNFRSIKVATKPLERTGALGETKQTRAFLKLIEEGSERLYTRAPISDVTMENKLVNALHTMNRTQEYYWRRVRFEASTWRNLTRRGFNPKEILENGVSGLSRVKKAQVEKAVNVSVRDALDITFAAPKSSFLLKVWAKYPELLTVHPFPRFLFNSVDFWLKHNPLGLTRLMTERSRRALARQGISHTRVVVEAVEGSMLIAGAAGLQSQKDAGEKWYNFKIGDTTLDARPFGAHAAYLYFGDIIARLARNFNEAPADLDVVARWESAAIQTKKELKVSDAAEALAGIRRLSGTGLAVVEALGPNVTAEGAIDRATRFFTEWLQGYTPFLAQFKDAVTGPASEAERAQRDIRAFEPISGPLSRLPIIGQQVPERPDPTAPKEFTQPASTGILRQTTGLSTRIRTPFQEELDRLDIRGSAFASTGNNELNAMIDAKVQEFITTQGIVDSRGRTALDVSSARFQKLDDHQRKQFIKRIYENARAFAKNAVIEEHGGEIVTELIDQMRKLPFVEAKDELERLKNAGSINTPMQEAILEALRR